MDALQALGQVAWIVDYEDDIASDLSVFHRIDNPGSMDSVDYIKKAKRLFAYRGVLRARLEHEQEQENGAHDSRYSPPQQAREVPLSQILSMTGAQHVQEGE